MNKNYETYSEGQFLEDDFFIEWIKYVTPESESFWEAWIQSHPANLEVMRKAERQLRAILSAERIEVENGEAQEVWGRVQHTLEAPYVPARSGRGKLRFIHRGWWMAAAVLLLLVTGVWFFAELKGPEKPSLVVAPKAGQDIAPGREGAVLTLADGSQILLDSANNGTLARQGAVDISKKGNRLVYDQSGKSSEVLYNIISTPRGRQYQMVLSDGSRVWLNAASSIKFPTAFTGDTRGVEISGEAYFEVAHNPGKPFIVSVNNMKVEVLGTHFNINAYSDEENIKTTLLQGSVKVSKGEKKVLLHPGQQAQSSLSSAEIRIANEVNLEEVMAWKNGNFSFSNADIQTVMRQLARWYDVTVEYQGAVPQRAFEGEMQRDLMLSQALKILEKNHVHFKVEGKKIVVFP